ncbi:glutathione peroxidase [Amantichitinum ursilacus]|uniref:Glutathione peroxidase n=1 Tax=Amantichitinum ursilacus TaxID=857265 RepID=A0A0N0XKA1_9NEIS|nr:glutathione peroxidase [Amantichitinum ursilacus]KPC54527.1 Hydroperoxy fatty acid reductase gpx1 [Amantichitinum ursilacus]
MAASLYEIHVTDIAGNDVAMERFRGQVILVVNVASKCGFTPQYEGLQALYQQYRDRGLVVLGFPCNQFGAQEPGSEAEIQQFCSTSYGVDFPMFARVDVNGEHADPLFQHLKASQPGLLGTEGIKWNFTKFLIDRQGNVVDRFAPTTTPDSLRNDIEKRL